MAFRIQSKDIVYGERLGAGGFGEVFKAKWDRTEVAVKQLTLKSLSESTIKEFKKEVEVHLNLRHPHIVQMYGVTSEQPYGMVMELMENGSLDRYLQNNPPESVSWSLKYKIALAVCKALSYLHKNGIIHRDLKSLNILLNKSLDAKVCDFGLAKVKTETISRTQATSLKGTIQWTAPELFSRKPIYNAKTDTYSYGIVLWELASHQYPYNEVASPQIIISFVKDGEREEFPENTPKEYESLAKKCWDGKSENRPELESVIVTLDSLLALSNESKQVNNYVSSYLFSSSPNQNNNASGYLQPTTNDLESSGYLNSSVTNTNTAYISSFPSNQPGFQTGMESSSSSSQSLQLSKRKHDKHRHDKKKHERKKSQGPIIPTSSVSQPTRSNKIDPLDEAIAELKILEQKKAELKLLPEKTSEPSPLIPSKQPHPDNPYPTNSNPFPINNSPVIQPPQPKPILPLRSPLLPSCAFGAAEWKKYFGDVGIEPPLPKDIDQILSASCPFWPGKKVQETHLLVLVPQTVGGKSLTLKTLGELVKKPLTGPATELNVGYYLKAYTDPAAPPSHWVLMTRDLIEGSPHKSYKDQQKLLNKKGQGDYAVPTILDATVCIFMEHFRSGTRLYPSNPGCGVYTRCQEKYDDDSQFIVGCFASYGLHVREHSYDFNSSGVGAVRIVS
jgi:serine/threonine protein kinase